MSGAEPDPGDSPTTTQWRRASRFYRQPPGLAWLIGLVLAPLLLGVIGYGMLDRSRLQAGGGPELGGALPTLIEPPGMPSAPPPSGLALAPLSVIRHGNEFTLNGDLPDTAAKRALLDSLIASVGDDVNIIDNLGVDPNIKALDFSSAGPVFKAAAAIPDFSLTVHGDSVILAGTAPTEGDEAAVTDAAVNAWQNVNIVNKVEIAGPVAPGPSLTPLSIVRDGDNVTLSGDLPDGASRTSLLATLKGIFGPDVNLIDNLNVKPGANVPDFSGLTAVLKAARSMPDFNFRADGDTITLIGTAASDSEKAAVEAAAKGAWPNRKIVNNIGISAPAPAPSPSPAPSSAPGGGQSCGSLQADITGLMRTPINFATDGSTVSPGSGQQLTQVADRLKACQGVHVAVNGYTDNTGSDAVNRRLSNNRAKSVADFLVAHGVPADQVTAKGFGSADPVASNDTPEGRAQNRRVVIVVS
jgi:peptidoglycan-binding protein ArfA